MLFEFRALVLGDEEEILKMLMNIVEQYKNGELQSYNLPEFIKKYERSALTGQLAYWFDNLHQVK